MAACSTACNVPGTAAGVICASRKTSRPTTYQNARVSSSECGRNSSSTPEQLTGEGVETLVARDPGAHPHAAEPERAAPDDPRSSSLEQRDVGVDAWLAVLAAVEGLDVGDLIVEIELGDAKRLALVQVHRTRMHQTEGTTVLDGADHRGVGQRDAELVVGPRPQADASRRPTTRRPHRDGVVG